MLGLSANFPKAWDEVNHTLAVVFRSPARLVLLDSDTGAVRETQETCGDADDVFFDSRRQRIYVSCGCDSVDVCGADNGTYRLLARIPTSSGACTSLFVPELDRLFVPSVPVFWGRRRHSRHPLTAEAKKAVASLAGCPPEFMALPVVIITLFALPAAAGPPFRTGDPEPVDFGHFEIYLFSLGTRNRNGSDGILWGLEVNYGAALVAVRPVRADGVHIHLVG